MENIRKIDELFLILDSKNNKLRFDAFQELIKLTEKKVAWIYDKWFILLDKLSSDNSFQRSIGLLLLANLSKSDTENRLNTILDKYLMFLEDEKFITSRQCIQNVWKIALDNRDNCNRIMKGLEKTYYENIHLKSHANLIKQDVIFSLNRISKYTEDNTAVELAKRLIESETEEKLKKELKKNLN